MGFRSILLATFVFFFTMLGCSKSEMRLEEKKAKNFLTSAKLQERHQGTSTLLKLQTKEFDLGRKTIDLAIKTLDNEIQTKKSFEEKKRAEGKNINQVMEEFDKKYPHREYTDYLEYLAVLITNSRAPKGIPIVFQFILNGGYVSNGAILTNFGNPAFDFLIDRATRGPEDERELAVSMLSIWINPPRDFDHIDVESIPPLKRNQKERLKPLLLKGFQEPNLEIKYYAIRGLGVFLDQPEIKTKLLKLTTSGETEEIRSQAKRILQNAAEQQK